MNEILLFDYWRSSACYRVRIALNLKSISYSPVVVNLVEGDQRNPEFLARNHQGLVPMLHIDGYDLVQSMAIIEYLDHHRPEPRLIPVDPLQRANAMATAMTIVADIHPLNNLRVLKYLKGEFEQEQEAIDRWYRHWITEGFTALEAMAPDHGVFGGEAPNVTDVCLVPQMYNARRFDLPMEAFPKLARINASLCQIEAFAKAAPEAVRPE